MRKSGGRWVSIWRPEQAPGAGARSSCPGGTFQGAGVRLGLGLTSRFWGGVNVKKGGVNVIKPYLEALDCLSTSDVPSYPPAKPLSG